MDSLALYNKSANLLRAQALVPNYQDAQPGSASYVTLHRYLHLGFCVC